MLLSRSASDSLWKLESLSFSSASRNRRYETASISPNKVVDHATAPPIAEEYPHIVSDTHEHTFKWPPEGKAEGTEPFYAGDRKGAHLIEVCSCVGNPPHAHTLIRTISPTPLPTHADIAIGVQESGWLHTVPQVIFFSWPRLSRLCCVILHCMEA